MHRHQGHSLYYVALLNFIHACYSHVLPMHKTDELYLLCSITVLNFRLGAFITAEGFLLQ